MCRRLQYLDTVRDDGDVEAAVSCVRERQDGDECDERPRCSSHKVSEEGADGGVLCDDDLCGHGQGQGRGV